MQSTPAQMSTEEDRMECVYISPPSKWRAYVYSLTQSKEIDMAVKTTKGAAAPENKVSKDEELKGLLNKAIRTHSSWATALSAYAFALVVTAHSRKDAGYILNGMALLDGKVEKSSIAKVRQFITAVGGITLKGKMASLAFDFDQYAFQEAYKNVNILMSTFKKEMDEEKPYEGAMSAVLKKARQAALAATGREDEEAAKALASLLETMNTKHIAPSAVLAMLTAK